MKRIQTLIQSLLLVSALTFSGSAFAGFNFGGTSCSGGSDTFSQAIPHNQTVEVGIIPKGKSNVKVDLTSAVDLDIQLIDVLTDTPIVHWQTGVVKGQAPSCAIYKKVQYCYSGYAGVDGQPGNEYIHINGNTNREVKMLAYGYVAGDAQVDYSWDAHPGCVDAGSGEFDQTLIKNDVVEVGTIPAGKQNVEVNLEADGDVDIEIYHGDKAIVAWKCFNKPNHAAPCLSSGFPSTVDYEGMTLSYSGFTGVNGQAGHEFIKIAGELTQPLTVKAFAYAAGTANVKYSWGPNADDGTSSPADGTSAPADDTSAPVAGESTPSNTPDPASYCGDNMGFDSGINMCIIQPEYTAAKDQCDADLTAANTAKSSCESAKLTCDSDLAAANTAKSSCEANLAQETKALEDEIALTLGYAADIAALTTEKAACESTKQSCESDLVAANTAKQSCESDLVAANTAKSSCESGKTTVESNLATCQFDLTAAQSNGSGAAFDLNAHYFAIEGTVATPTPLSICSPTSEFEVSAPTPLLDRVCSPITVCGSNQYEALAPTAKSDRVCQNQPTCASGQIVTVPGTLVSAQVCADPCPAGEYKDVTVDACVAVTACTDEEVETKAPTAISDRECGPKPDVITYQYNLGTLNMSTGKFDSKLLGDDGSIVTCTTMYHMGNYQLDCRNYQLKGRIAIHEIAKNMKTLLLHYNSITEIVSLERTGNEIDELGGGSVEEMMIYLGGIVSHLPNYGNPGFDGGCPAIAPEDTHGIGQINHPASQCADDDSYCQDWGGWYSCQ